MTKGTDGRQVKLGGRTFTVAHATTIGHDAWIMKRVRQAGLADIEMRPGEAVGAFADRILAELLVSDATNEIMAGLLLPEGMTPEQWTPAHAEATAVWIRSLTDEADKKVYRNLMVSAVIDFFKIGLMRLNRGGTYSEADPRTSPTSGAQQTPAGSVNGTT